MEEGNFFKSYFNNAAVNSILIMETNGNIIRVNAAFTKNFGYTTDDLKGKNLSELFTASDRNKNVPKMELEEVLKTAQSNDEGFLVNKEGHAVWCTGEALLITDDNGDKFIVKDVINLQSKDYLNLFLHNTKDLLDRMFHTSKDIPMMILDGSLRNWDVNAAFYNFFNIEKKIGQNAKLSDLQSAFWNKKEIREALSKVVVSNISLKRKEYVYETSPGVTKKILIDAKIIFMQPEAGRKVYVIIEEISEAG